MLRCAASRLLLDRLRADGRLVAKDLAVELGSRRTACGAISANSAAAGLCQRVYGGALPVSPAVADYATRQDVETDSKRRVAAAAAALVVPGSTVILDGGTTTLAVARALPRDLRAPSSPTARRSPPRSPTTRKSRSSCSAAACSSTRRSPAGPRPSRRRRP